VTTPSQDAWDLDRIRQIVAHNDLERGRIESKRELSSGALIGQGRTARQTRSVLQGSPRFQGNPGQIILRTPVVDTLLSIGEKLDKLGGQS
jgi:hypothetical protein